MACQPCLAAAEQPFPDPRGPLSLRQRPGNLSNSNNGLETFDCLNTREGLRLLCRPRRREGQPARTLAARGGHRRQGGKHRAPVYLCTGGGLQGCAKTQRSSARLRTGNQRLVGRSRRKQRRIARKLVLLAMMAVAATALTAPSAFAASASQHDSRSVEPQLPHTAPERGFSLRETGPVAPRETATVLLCLSDKNNEHGAQTHCEVELSFTETSGGFPTDHRYHFSARPLDPVDGGIPCHHSPTTEEPRAEILGEFNAENVNSPAGPEGGSGEHRVEINHT